MRFGIITGVVCITISLGLLFLGNFKFDNALDYFKGTILGLGVGLVTGNLYGYFTGVKIGKRNATKKFEKTQEKSTETSQPSPH